MMIFYSKFMVLTALFSLSYSCEKKHFNSSSFTCVCSSKKCDLPGNPQVRMGNAKIYTNTRDELRAAFTTIKLRGKIGQKADSVITLNSEVRYQSIIGFGGSFTDSTGIVISKLPTSLQTMLLRTYFSNEGANYNLCRIPIAGSDFSTRPYSYDDFPGDIELKKFSLTEEDKLYKIPYIKTAMELSKQTIHLFASPWSPPFWMKTNGKVNGRGSLIKEMYQPWANYIVKFINSYEEELGVKLWGLTPQNEPISGMYEEWKFNSCAWTPSDLRDWIASNLGPTLEAAGLRRVKLMVTDLTRRDIMDYVSPILASTNSSKFVDGITLHWYFDSDYGTSILDELHNLSPERFMLYSEACTGHVDNDVIMGSWERGEEYITNIIETMNHWQSGWVDWNMALDMQGGPNWAGNFVDSPIIVNSEAEEFYLQPLYFAMTHFSKFVDRDARRINFTVTNDLKMNLHVTAFTNPDQTTVVVIANLGEEKSVIQLKDDGGHLLTKELQPKSWHTITYAASSKTSKQINNEL